MTARKLFGNWMRKQVVKISRQGMVHIKSFDIMRIIISFAVVFVDLQAISLIVAIINHVHIYVFTLGQQKDDVAGISMLRPRQPFLALTYLAFPFSGSTFTSQMKTMSVFLLKKKYKCQIIGNIKLNQVYEFKLDKQKKKNLYQNCFKSSN